MRSSRVEVQFRGCSPPTQRAVILYIHPGETGHFVRRKADSARSSRPIQSWLQEARAMVQLF